MFPTAVEAFKENFSGVYGEAIRNIYNASVKNPKITNLEADDGKINIFFTFKIIIYKIKLLYQL